MAEKNNQHVIKTVITILLILSLTSAVALGARVLYLNFFQDRTTSIVIPDNLIGSSSDVSSDQTSSEDASSDTTSSASSEETSSASSEQTSSSPSEQTSSSASVSSSSKVDSSTTTSAESREETSSAVSEETSSASDTTSAEESSSASSEASSSDSSNIISSGENLSSAASSEASTPVRKPVILTPGGTVYGTQLELYRGNAEDGVPFEVGNMFPGDYETRYFGIRAYHSEDINVFFEATVTEETKNLSDALHIRVTYLNNDQVLYDGPFSGFPEEDIPVSFLVGDGLDMEYRPDESDGSSEYQSDPSSEYQSSAALPGSAAMMAARTMSIAIRPSASPNGSLGYYAIDVYLPTSTGNEYQNAMLKANFRWYADAKEQYIPPVMVWPTDPEPQPPTSSDESSDVSSDDTSSEESSDVSSDDPSSEESSDVSSDDTPSEDDPLDPKPPQTGDISNTLLWGVLSASSLAMLILLLVLFVSRRKKEEDDHVE